MVSTIYRQLQELETFDSRGAAVLSLYFNTMMEGRAEADAFGEVERLVRPLRERLDETRQADMATELEAVRDYLGSLLTRRLRRWATRPTAQAVTASDGAG